MDWQGLFRKISSEHPHNHHVLSRCEIAVQAAKEALQTLSAHGYIFHLAEGLGQPYPSWPRKLFHVDAAPNGRTVLCEQDALELGAGWFDSFQRAQFWDGLEAQFNGRGGVPKTPRVPAKIYGPITLSADEVERLEQLKLQVAAFRAANKWEKPNAAETERSSDSGERSEAGAKGGSPSESGQWLLRSGQGAQNSEASEQQVPAGGKENLTLEIPSKAKPEVVTLRDSGAAAESVA